LFFRLGQVFYLFKLDGRPLMSKDDQAYVAGMTRARIEKAIGRPLPSKTSDPPKPPRMSTFWTFPSSPAAPAVKWEAETSAYVRSQPFPTKILVQGGSSSQSPEPEPEPELKCITPAPTTPVEEDKEEPSSFLDDNLSSPERLKLFNEIYTPMEDDKASPPHPTLVDMCDNYSGCRCWNVPSALFT
jgi:hypothetical protein